MATHPARSTLLEEILEGCEVSRFSRQWIDRSMSATEEGMRDAYALLRGYGASDKRIAQHATLLAASRSAIQGRYENLRSWGLSKKKIADELQLLSLRLPTIKRRYETLGSFGMVKRKIAAEAELLGQSPLTLRNRHRHLVALGLRPNQIVSNATLLTRKSETIDGHHAALAALGLPGKKIAAYPSLLSRDPATVREHYDSLRRLGIRHDKIMTLAFLLMNDPATLAYNFWRLTAMRAPGRKDSLGMPAEKVAAHPYLLSRDIDAIIGNYGDLRRMGYDPGVILAQPALLSYRRKTVRANYEHHVGLLRYDWRLRYLTGDAVSPARRTKEFDSGSGTLRRYPTFLGVPQATFEGNFQYLNARGILYSDDARDRPGRPFRKEMLLGSSAQAKREKEAWLLREVFDYRAASSDAERRHAIEAMRRFVKKTPHLLVNSIETLLASQPRLRTRAKGYLHPVDSVSCA